MRWRARPSGLASWLLCQQSKASQTKYGKFTKRSFYFVLRCWLLLLFRAFLHWLGKVVLNKYFGLASGGPPLSLVSLAYAGSASFRSIKSACGWRPPVYSLCGPLLLLAATVVAFMASPTLPPTVTRRPLRGRI